MIQQHQENHDNALRHLEEADEFLNRIEEKKEQEVRKWREKLKNIEERERLLEYYRQKRMYDQRNGKHRKRHDDSRKSVWDVDNVLLKHIMDELTDNERKELEILGVCFFKFLWNDFYCNLGYYCLRERERASENGESLAYYYSKISRHYRC